MLAISRRGFPTPLENFDLSYEVFIKAGLELRLVVVAWSGGPFPCSQSLQSLVAGVALLSNALATPYLRGKGILPHTVPPAAQTTVART